MTDLLLTTTVGSFGKPDYLQKARNAKSATGARPGRDESAPFCFFTKQPGALILSLWEQKRVARAPLPSPQCAAY